MLKLLAATLTVLFLALPAFPQNTQATASAPSTQATGATAEAQPPNTVDLNTVIRQVKAAIDKYQKNRGSGSDALPPLSLAEFDFKTTTGTKGGLSINLFIFKIGASRESDVVNDVTYTYTLPKPKPPSGIGILEHRKPVPLTDALAQSIQNAAATLKNAESLGPLNFSKLTLTIQYGVTWDGNGGVNIPIQLVTLGLNVDKNKNSVQSVKLVFGQ